MRNTEGCRWVCAERQEQTMRVYFQGYAKSRGRFCSWVVNFLSIRDESPVSWDHSGNLPGGGYLSFKEKNPFVDSVVNSPTSMWWGEVLFFFPIGCGDVKQSQCLSDSLTNPGSQVIITLFHQLNQDQKKKKTTTTTTTKKKHLITWTVHFCLLFVISPVVCIILHGNI